MQHRFIYCFLPLILLIGGLSLPVMAQQADTTQTTKKIEKRKKSFFQPYHSERSTHKAILGSHGSYDVPTPTQYYKPPFEGQKYLDIALEAYRKELKNSVANTPFFRFLSKIAPFVNNQFQFSVYNIEDLPIPGRDYPLLYPQK